MTVNHHSFVLYNYHSYGRTELWVRKERSGNCNNDDWNNNSDGKEQVSSCKRVCVCVCVCVCVYRGGGSKGEGSGGGGSGDTVNGDGSKNSEDGDGDVG